MGGGIIQISSYGSQDLFLTGIPEITFFKVVYRRYTNFSMESIKINFDDTVGFGTYSSVKIPKIGDLMFKTYVQILLPEINLFRHIKPNNCNFINHLQQTEIDYNIVTNFMRINRNAYVAAYDIYIAENNIENASCDMINVINDIFSLSCNQNIIDQFRKLIIFTPNLPFTYNEISLESIVNLFDATSNKNNLFKALSVGIDKSIKTQNFFFLQVKTAKLVLEDAENPHIKFAWVNRLGHAIMESIEINIGGQTIDKHYGDWINIWYELSANRDLEKIYFKMIGHVPELTCFDRKVKPTYLLQIPLQFWFCRYSGLSIPLVALQYHDVNINIKFRRFEELCYIEPLTNIKIANIDDGIHLDEIPEETLIDMEAFLLIDYIYLDSPERRRFAQSSHEYLIDQLQFLEINDVTQQKIQVNINNFVNPSKELIWVSQKESFTINPEGSNQCMWDNYSLNEHYEFNPIIYSSIDFHSYNRVIKLDGNYFNYVQPYETHSTTPSDGINLYSFSLFPEEEQPSGSANMSRLSRVVIYMEFYPILFANNNCIDPLTVRIYSRSLNILRFLSGFCGLSFTYG